MYIATFKNDADHKFNVYIDVSGIETVETAQARSKKIVEEVLGEDKKKYIFLEMKEVSLEEFYRSKGRNLEEEIPEASEEEEEEAVVEVADE